MRTLFRSVARRLGWLPTSGPGARFWGGVSAVALAGPLLVLPAPADEAVTWIESYDEALAEARRTGKPIFLEFRCAP